MAKLALAPNLPISDRKISRKIFLLKEIICEIICSAYLESLQGRVVSSLEQAADDTSHTGYGLEIS